MQNMSMESSTDRIIKAPTGNELNCKNWVTEGAYRMLMNNLDPDVAEKPENLVVYGGTGKAARNWESYHLIVSPRPPWGMSQNPFCVVLRQLAELRASGDNLADNDAPSRVRQQLFQFCS